MRSALFVIFLAVGTCFAQNAIQVSGDAEVKVVPNEVSVFFGVENRNKDISTAVAQNNASVKQLIAAIRSVGVDPSDIQTDYYHVDIAYLQNQPSAIDYYVVSKQVQVVLKNVSRFEDLLNSGLRAGANHLGGIEFRTTELRKYRDEARTLAAKAAVEKAKGLADAAGLKVGKALSLTSYSYGGGSSYVSWSPYGSYGYGSMAPMSQNVVQDMGGKSDGSAKGTISLGKISITASVSMTFQIQQ
jgi:uncharacterized protein